MKRFKIVFSGEGWKDTGCEGIFVDGLNAMAVSEYAKKMLDHWDIDHYGVKIKVVEDRDEIPNIQS